MYIVVTFIISYQDHQRRKHCIRELFSLKMKKYVPIVTLIGPELIRNVLNYFFLFFFFFFFQVGPYKVSGRALLGSEKLKIWNWNFTGSMGWKKQCNRSNCRGWMTLLFPKKGTKKTHGKGDIDRKKHRALFGALTLHAVSIFSFKWTKKFFNQLIILICNIFFFYLFIIYLFDFISLSLTSYFLIYIFNFNLMRWSKITDHSS